MITTYLSKTGSNGGRLNLVVNEDKKEIYFKSHTAFEIGNIIDELGIGEVNRMYKDYLKEGYEEVNHTEVKLNWRV